MVLTIDDVRGLAKLSRLKLADDEAEKMLVELNQILVFVDKLQEVNIEGLEPTAQVTGLVNVMRDDEVEDMGVDRSALLKNAPQQQDGYIRVKRVL